MIKLFKQKLIKIPVPNKRVDERDTMFARMARKPNNSAYKDYYSNHPGLIKKDDYIRSLPALLDTQGKYYTKKYSERAHQLFESIENIIIDKDVIVKYSKLFAKNEINPKHIKYIIKGLGGVATRFTHLEKMFIYSHKGRFDNNYGDEILLDHPSIIVFLVEMDYEQMSQSPKSNVIAESANQYYRAALISKTLEAIIKNIGYEAKAHFDANYDIILPPLAVQAGLGELGRNNILIADKYGSRVRIGAISTNMPLEYDEAISIGVENCYTLWRKYGTDCGICMAVCPFSHKNNWLHNLVRSFVKYFPIFNNLLVIIDNIIYGKKWRIKQI